MILKRISIVISRLIFSFFLLAMTSASFSLGTMAMAEDNEEHPTLHVKSEAWPMVLFDDPFYFQNKTIFEMGFFANPVWSLNQNRLVWIRKADQRSFMFFLNVLHIGIEPRPAMISDRPFLEAYLSMPDCAAEPLDVPLCLKNLKFSVHGASWSPDGGKAIMGVAIHNQNYVDNTAGELKKWGLYQYDVINNKRSRYLLSSNRWVDHSPLYSPDGSSICFISDRDNKKGNLYLLDLKNGGEPIHLCKTRGFPFGPRWSRDSRYVYFHTLVGDTYRICRTDANSKDQTYRILTGDEKTSQFPFISPDGGNMAFFENDVVRVMELENETVTANIRFPTPMRSRYALTWIDNRRFIYIAKGSFLFREKNRMERIENPVMLANIDDGRVAILRWNRPTEFHEYITFNRRSRLLCFTGVDKDTVYNKIQRDLFIVSLKALE